MNQMKSNCLLLLITVLLGSCGSPEPTSSSNQLEFTPSGAAIISLQDENYVDDPGDLLENETFIALKGKDDKGLFRIINKLMITRDTLIVYDNMLAKMVVFDQDGNFLHEIFRQGKGPEEYVYINDVFYWEGVNVVDPSTYQIIRYGLDGTWLSKQKFDPYKVGTSIERNEGAYIFYRNSMNYMRPARGYNFASATLDSLHILDSASFISHELATHQYMTANPFAKFNGSIYALPPFEEVIYRMNSEGKIDSAFVIDVPQNQQLAKDPIWLETNVDNFEFRKTLFNNIEAIKNFRTLMIQEDLIGFSFTKNKESHFCLYDRKKGTTRFFKTSLLTDDPAISLSLSAVQGEDLYFQVHSREAGKVAEYTGLDLGEDVNAVLLKTRWRK